MSPAPHAHRLPPPHHTAPQEAETHYERLERLQREAATARAIIAARGPQAGAQAKPAGAEKQQKRGKQVRTKCTKQRVCMYGMCPCMGMCGQQIE